MTNQQGAQEALTLAGAVDHWARVDYGLRGDEMRKAAAELRRLHYENERLAALVDAQQPATHVQQSAEIEHVAGDVSKNGAEVNMAQQPAQSAAAAQQGGVCDKAPAGWLCTRQHGHEGPCAAEPTLSARSEEWVEGYAAGVRDGWKDALRTQQPSPTAQADSVTAPAGGADWQDISTAPKDGTRFVAVGQNYGLDSEAQHTCIAQWLAGCWVEVSDWNGASKLKYLTHWMPLPPLPCSAARTPADSVLEDAARLDWLALAGPTSICLVIDRPHDGEVEVSTDDATGYGKTLREALDAARKQGANHD